MNRCDQCDWWLPFDIDNNTAPGWLGDCTLLSESYGHNNDAIQGVRIVKINNPSVANILTAADFGCVRWALKVVDV